MFYYVTSCGDFKLGFVYHDHEKCEHPPNEVYTTSKMEMFHFQLHEMFVYFSSSIMPFLYNVFNLLAS